MNRAFLSYIRHHDLIDTVVGLHHNRYESDPVLHGLSTNTVISLTRAATDTSVLSDWVQDAARERVRRRARHRRYTGLYQGGRMGWRDALQASYEAAQGWIVVTLVGVAIGLNAAFLNIVTEWLSDIKLGRCKSAFYLNENFCCWGEKNGE